MSLEYGIVNAGRLRKRITLESSIETQDGYGQAIKTWVAVGTYWGEIRPLTGRELVNAQQIKAVVSHMVTLRYQPSVTVTPDMRFTYAGRIFQPGSILDADERNRRLDIMAQEMKAPLPS